mmetsp:Transcript_26719/g.73511  ORF Transcript_26719/g.73511 Transcript_26719/m.73511 type:complete len:231 (+) Transcript_26719:597-1289(+)
MCRQRVGVGEGHRGMGRRSVVVDNDGIQVSFSIRGMVGFRHQHEMDRGNPHTKEEIPKEEYDEGGKQHHNNYRSVASPPTPERRPCRIGNQHRSQTSGSNGKKRGQRQQQQRRQRQQRGQRCNTAARQTRWQSALGCLRLLDLQGGIPEPPRHPPQRRRCDLVEGKTHAQLRGQTHRQDTPAANRRRLWTGRRPDLVEAGVLPGSHADQQDPHPMGSRILREHGIPAREK